MTWLTLLLLIWMVSQFWRQRRRLPPPPEDPTPWVLLRHKLDHPDTEVIAPPPNPHGLRERFPFLFHRHPHTGR